MSEKKKDSVGLSSNLLFPFQQRNLLAVFELEGPAFTFLTAVPEACLLLSNAILGFLTLHRVGLQSVLRVLGSSPKHRSHVWGFDSPVLQL